MFPWTEEKPRIPGWYFVKNHKYPAHMRKFEMTESGHIEPKDGPLSTDGWKLFSGPFFSPDDICKDSKSNP